MFEGSDEDDNFFVVHQPKKKQQNPKQHCRPRNKAPAIRESQIHPEEIKNMRISSEFVVNEPGSNSETLVQSITCPVCLMLLSIPYQECQVCCNGFCDGCIQSWWAKSPNTCIFKCQNAQFKQIKRSNTYNALLQTLKIKCEYCSEELSISEIQNHLLKSCKQIKETCRFCGIEKKREQIQKHETEECLERLYECPHCNLMFLAVEESIHEEDCPNKQLSCKFIGCDLKIPRKNMSVHEKNCKMRLITCQWCQNQITFLKNQQTDHENTCQKRQYFCQWCKEAFNAEQIMSHQCSLKRQICRLCEEQILTSEIEKHKFDCMFENIVEIKRKNVFISNENERLKEKVAILQGIIEQSIQSRDTHTLKFMKEMREQDKSLVERDLLRIDNSIKSVEKLKKQEFTSHMKYPHLIQSWCPICREMEKKFKAMLDPLLASRKNTLQKLSEIEKFSMTPN